MKRAYIIGALAILALAGCGADADTEATDRAVSSFDGSFQVDVVEEQPTELADGVGDAATALVAKVNDVTSLRRDVTIALGGDEDGPFYDPETRTIQYPWAFFTEVRRLLATQDYNGDALDEATSDAALFVLAHEMGHAVIDLRSLPVLGKEEDAADSFASYIAVDVLEQPDQVIGASDLFGAWDDEAAGDTYADAEFFDSHSLDAQRFYTVSCWVYGADPAKNANVVEGLDIDDERLAECEEEWDRMDENWSELLDD